LSTTAKLGAIFYRLLQSRGVCPVWTREVLQIQTSILFGAKNFEFFNIYGVPSLHRQGRLSQCGYFADKGEGSIFVI